jgi:hypothetical protein
MMLLVSYWRADSSKGQITPGDAVIGADGFPATGEDVEALRTAVKRIVEVGARPADKIVLVNVVKLGG